MYSGRHDDYRWLASHKNRDHLPGVLRSCPQLVLGKFVAITSFDSGPLIPSPEELRAGWSCDGRIMYSSAITDPSLIPHEQYDEWLIFSNETKQLPELQVFINFGGFTLAEGDPDVHREHRERLWSQLARVSAESYVAEGDYFLFASKNEAVFECVEEAVKRLRVVEQAAEADGRGLQVCEALCWTRIVVV